MVEWGIFPEVCVFYEVFESQKEQKFRAIFFINSIFLEWTFILLLHEFYFP